MLRFDLKIQEIAQQDIDESADWYRQRGVSLSSRFLKEIRRKLAFITINPYLYPVIYRTYHQAVLQKFPFALYYYILDNQITIIGCLHTSRNRDRILEERI